MNVTSFSTRRWSCCSNGTKTASASANSIVAQKPKVYILLIFCLFLFLHVPSLLDDDTCNKQHVLSMALSPPAEDKINRAILSPKEAGALTLYKDGKFTGDDGELTFAGLIMTELSSSPS